MSGACPSGGETTAVGRPSDAGTAAPRPGPGPDGFQFEVEELHCLLVRIVREGRQVARAQLHHHPPGALDVADLFAAPEHRGRGLARAVPSYCLLLPAPGRRSGRRRGDSPYLATQPAPVQSISLHGVPHLPGGGTPRAPCREGSGT